MHVLANADIIASATVHDLRMFPGPANSVSVSVTWDPLSLGGTKAVSQGRHVISDYLSGKNAIIALQSHHDSFPGMPGVGDALKKIRMEFSLPPMDLPDNGDDDDDEGSHGFIRNAVFHLFSSSATFDLASPLKHNTIYIEKVNATAFYNHTQPVGTIVYNESIKVPPGITETPYLPVEWDLDSVGFDKMKDALGGTLRLDAVANVTVRLGEWVEEIYYQGRGIGASIGF
ncbi:hypothetical protein VHEMI01738 [[Torrubiella] hemipterigena]|uniref:Tag1-like fifth Ig-like domain-containing protein n=1 Tax=[Torrubiella] hemipterigena TaxID=1531966 RepID=A0A0A1SMQ3_9HYPO|nr:hypothetical protein VHEMI01738 [[Torrubiella] hemipterigena]